MCSMKRRLGAIRARKAQVVVRAANIGPWCLAVALSLALSACLVAVSAHTSGAYFTDVKFGTIAGTFSTPNPPPVPTSPYRLEAGTSKALHDAQGNDHSGKEPAIAQLDASEALYLDFGDAPAGRGDDPTRLQGSSRSSTILAP